MPSPDSVPDTIGSIAGKVAGAHLGLSRLPPELGRLGPVQEILPAAQAFARKVMAVSGDDGD